MTGLIAKWLRKFHTPPQPRVRNTVTSRVAGSRKTHAPAIQLPAAGHGAGRRRPLRPCTHRSAASAIIDIGIADIQTVIIRVVVAGHVDVLHRLDV